MCLFIKNEMGAQSTSDLPVRSAVPRAGKVPLGGALCPDKTMQELWSQRLASGARD